MKKTKSTRRALLMSTLSLLTCISMLIGSTFAWFTDSAISDSNKVQTGTMQIALVDANGASLEGEMIEWAAKDGRPQEEIFWEPGCTYETESFYIQNTGNLRLKFKFAITGIDGDAELLEVIDFTVTADGSPMDFNTGAEYVLAPGDQIGPLVLSGHMDETAGNKYQSKTIEGIAVSITAAQATGEVDSFSDTYDEKAIYPATNIDNLKNALANGNAVLAESITAEAGDNSGYGKAGVVVENGAVLDGNGETLNITDADNTWDCAVNITGGTVKNLTITGGFRGIFVSGATADILIDNCILDDVVYTFNSDAGSKDYSVTIKNTILNGWTSFSDVHKYVDFINCNFGEGSGYAFCRPYNDCTFTDCSFEEGFEFDTTKAGSITFVNCYYGEVLITAENAATLGVGDTIFFYNGVGNANFQ